MYTFEILIFWQIKFNNLIIAVKKKTKNENGVVSNA